MVAVEDEEKEAETRALATEPDREMRERTELRSRASLTNFLTAAISGRQVSGAEAELQSAAGNWRRNPAWSFGTCRSR